MYVLRGATGPTLVSTQDSVRNIRIDDVLVFLAYQMIGKKYIKIDPLSI